MTTLRKRGWWRNRRSLLYFGLSAFVISLVIGAGCAGTKPAKPYRGTLLKNVTLSKALVDAWSKKKFDPSGNCVQMVWRDKTEDGVRKGATYLMFSPDPCSPNNVANERESFALPFVKKSSFSDNEKLPATAYHLVENNNWVGNITLLSRGAPSTQAPAGPELHSIAANAAATFENDTYELADLCTFDAHFKQNCEVDFTVDGKFSQVNTTRATIGKAEREKTLVTQILTRIDQSEISLRWDPLESTCRHASLSIL